jgi:fructose-bisphosphate aldolase class 1
MLNHGSSTLETVPLEGLKMQLTSLNGRSREREKCTKRIKKWKKVVMDENTKSATAP